MSQICLVTGANGHLGYNLINALLMKGKKVRGGIRNLNYAKHFEKMGCEPVFTDLMKRESLAKAMNGVETLYQTAAVYKMWAREPKEEILLVNTEGTKNVLEIAAEQGVSKVIYVSSTAALDHAVVPMDETSWNNDFSNPYYQSKTESERLALHFAKKNNMDLVSILPSGMIGPNCHGHMTPTMEILHAIVNNRLPIDVNFNFNYVDVRDVAEGMIAAAVKGRSGERYILANEDHISTTEIIEMAQSLLPGIKKPRKGSRAFVMLIALMMELVSKITKTAPNLTRSVVRSYYSADQRMNISKARRELGFQPRKPHDAVGETLFYLAERGNYETEPLAA